MGFSLGQKDFIAQLREEKSYQVGEIGQRPWGRYTVLDVGQNFCRKEIVILPGHVLSLQSHDLRSETWSIKSGALTVIIDAYEETLHAGATVYVPQRAIHCMANLGQDPCQVWELQEGICREEDIQRYADAYGRCTLRDAGGEGTESLRLYRQILAALAKGEMSECL